MTTITELEKIALEDLTERIIDNPLENDWGDSIFEIADSTTPIYNYDLLKLAADNIFLATNDPELGPAFDGSPTPVNIIAANVFEYLESFLWENLEDLQEEILEELADQLDDDNQILP